MICNGIHSSKDVPPNVSMITGITPSRALRKLMEDTVESTITAVMKALSPQLLPHSHVSSALTSQVGIAVSPGKSVDIHGKCSCS